MDGKPNRSNGPTLVVDAESLDLGTGFARLRKMAELPDFEFAKSEFMVNRLTSRCGPAQGRMLYEVGKIFSHAHSRSEALMARDSAPTDFPMSEILKPEEMFKLCVAKQVIDKSEIEQIEPLKGVMRETFKRLKPEMKYVEALYGDALKAPSAEKVLQGPPKQADISL